MSHAIAQDEISLTCFRKDFERYSWEAFRTDVLAGLSVAMLALPQSLAYALVAGLPIITGLFASIYSAFIASLFGSSRHLIVGTSNAIAILIQGGISSILFTYYRDVPDTERDLLVMHILTQLMLLVGIIQILAAFLKLGRLIQFVSHTVIVAYIAGVALALVINQIFPLLGMPTPSGVTSLYEKTLYIALHLSAIHWPTAVVGMGCFFLYLFLRKAANPYMPTGAIMLAIVALISYGFGHFYPFFTQNFQELIDWSKIEGFFQHIALVGKTGDDDFIPSFAWPYFNSGIINNLLPVAFAIALLSIMESTSASKSVASSSGQHLSTNQEIFGLGLGNFFSAFIGASPLSGSSSRTALNYECGATTRLSALFNCFFVYLIIVSFGFLIEGIPLAAFSALLIACAGNIVNIKQLFLCLKATRSDALVLTLTLISCLFLSLDIAFYMGVATSITLYLKKAAIPQLVEFTVDGEGVLHTVDTALHEPRKIRFIKVEGELFFGAADLFQNTLKSIAEDDTTTRVIILQLKNARDIDATACLALQQLYDYLAGSGRYLIACGITHQIWEVLSDSGMIDLIGKCNLFIFDERHPQLSVQKAFHRAAVLLESESAKAAIETKLPLTQPKPVFEVGESLLVAARYKLRPTSLETGIIMQVAGRSFTREG